MPIFGFKQREVAEGLKRLLTTTDSGTGQSVRRGEHNATRMPPIQTAPTEFIGKVGTGGISAASDTEAGSGTVLIEFARDVDNDSVLEFVEYRGGFMASLGNPQVEIDVNNYHGSPFAAGVRVSIWQDRFGSFWVRPSIGQTVLHWKPYHATPASVAPLWPNGSTTATLLTWNGTSSDWETPGTVTEITVYDPTNGHCILPGEESQCVWNSESDRYEAIGGGHLLRRFILDGNCSVSGSATAHIITDSGEQSGWTQTVYNTGPVGEALVTGDEIVAMYESIPSKWVIIGAECA